MPSRTVMLTSALMAGAALAMSLATSAPAKSTKASITCTLELFAQGPPNPSATPSGAHFGLVDCPRPFGKGVHYDTYTLTPTGPGHGNVTVRFKNYFDRGTRSGTVNLTFAATSPSNISYTGTVSYTAGTGKYRHLRGGGAIQCTTTDAGAHKTCTVNSAAPGA